MKLYIAGIIASAALFNGACAAAAPKHGDGSALANLDLDLVGKHTPTLSADKALNIVNKLQHDLNPIEKKLNATAASVKKSSTKTEREQAIASAKKDLNAMAQMIYGAIDEVSTQARASSHNKRDPKSKGAGSSVHALAQALKHTLTTAAGTVNTLVASLGLTGLLSFLTPVTASLSGLVITLVPVVDSLLPILNILLDGVVTGLSGLLGTLLL